MSVPPAGSQITGADPREHGNALRILVLSDGVPGHDRSCFGIVSALAKFRAVDARLLPIKEIRGGSRRMKRTRARLMPFDRYWPRVYALGERVSLANPLPRIDALPPHGIDLVVSTGPATSAANIALARHYGAKNVYFGFPQWPVTGGFTLLLSPVAHRDRKGVAYALRPSEIDASELPPPRPLTADTERRAALLVGGDSKHYRYTPNDFDILARRLIDVSEALPWLSWTVFDSHRTPEKPFRVFADAIRASGRPIGIVRYRDRGLLSNRSAHTSDLVLATADSMSMIFEAAAARRPTGILAADGYKPPRRDALECNILLGNGHAFSLRFSELDAASLLAAAARIACMPGSELDALYATIARAGI